VKYEKEEGGTLMCLRSEDLNVKVANRLWRNVEVMTNPLAAHYITVYRDRSEEIRNTRAAEEILFSMMIVKAMESVPTLCGPHEVTTRTGDVYKGHRFEKPVAFVPILRAGEASFPSIFQLFPGSPVWHHGVKRDPITLQPHEYLNKMPAQIDPDTVVLCCDPAMATCGTGMFSVARLRERGAKKIFYLGLVSSVKGLEEFVCTWPDVPVLTCGIDPTLDENGYIRPGCGDAGDTHFNTQPDH
jgi:uracil phosphoribosyltransferase